MIDVLPELIEVHNLQKEKRKVNLILRSIDAAFPSVSFRNHVEIYVKLSHQKRSKWIGSKKILSLDLDSQSVTYPGERGKMCTAALEDIRVFIESKYLAKHPQNNNDQLDALLDDGIVDVLASSGSGSSIPHNENEFGYTFESD